MIKLDVVHSTTTHNRRPTPVTNLLLGEEGNILSLILSTNLGAAPCLLLLLLWLTVDLVRAFVSMAVTGAAD